jgi:hypothetical protein
MFEYHSAQTADVEWKGNLPAEERLKRTTEFLANDL